MSGENITKDEVKAMLDVQAKSTEQMTIVAQRLQVIADNQIKILDVLKNGLSDNIITKITDHHDKVMSQVKEMREPDSKMIKEIRDDAFWVKVIVGSCTLIIAVVELVTRFLIHIKIP